MVTDQNVRLLYTTQEMYNNLEQKSANTLYFITDTRKIYKGGLLFSNNVNVVTELPTLGIDDCLYILKGLLYYWSDGNFHQIITSSKQVIPGELNQFILSDGNYWAKNSGLVYTELHKSVYESFPPASLSISIKPRESWWRSDGGITRLLIRKINKDGSENIIYNLSTDTDLSSILTGSHPYLYITAPEGKKPALVFVTLEDDPVKLTHFLYLYIRCNNDPEFVEAVKMNPDLAKETLGSLDPREMAIYVRTDLMKNGFSIKIIHGNPSQWGYRDVIRRINRIEARGYHVQLLAIDYVTLLQSTGITVSVGGQEKYELIARLRAWASGKKLPVISPLQLSSDADQLLKNGVSPEAFGRIVKDRGYYHLCKTLGQPIDLENFVCKVVKGDRSYISVTRGKHRNASTIPPSKLFFFLPFPGDNIPLLEDIGKENSAYRQLPKENVNIASRTKEEEEFF